MKNEILEQKKNNQIKEIISFFKNKRTLLCCFYLTIFAFNIFAGNDAATELDNFGTSILDLFSATWVKALLVVGLIVEGLSMVIMGQRGGGGQVVQKFLPWIIGTIILLCATSIVNYFAGDLDLTSGLN